MRLNTAEEILQALNDGLEVICVFEGYGRRYLSLEEGSPVIRVFCDLGKQRNTWGADIYSIYHEMCMYSQFEACTPSNLPFKRLPV